MQSDFRAPMVRAHDFAMVPRHDIPRSTIRMDHNHKTTFNASALIPVFVTEIVPGDSFTINMTAFCRLQTPLFPLLDNMELESWFFFVPCRILWTHWVNFMGEQPSTPSDSISYTIPTITSAVGGFVAGSIYDYMGLPIGAQLAGNTQVINALPLRAYNLIWNQWYRDQNLDNAVGFGATNTVTDFGDGPDPRTNYSTLLVRKRHDYFTSALPWTQKGGVAQLPLTGQALVKTANPNQVTGIQIGLHLTQVGGGAAASNFQLGTGTTGSVAYTSTASGAQTAGVYPDNLYADLSTAAGNTINALRLAFQTQRLLERDARAGTRYTESIRAHFGVTPPDYRTQRPEYIGGGVTIVNMAAIPQTSATGLTGGTTAQGSLTGVGTAVARGHSARYAATEHGYILGLVTVRSNKLYQQGMRRLWSRSTRYDFYYPVFAGLGEQGIRNDEIYQVGTSQDTQIFGYQERWAEMRYMPSMTSAAFRSTFATPLDAWHLATNFGAAPTLGPTFIQDDTGPILQRNLAGGSTQYNNNQQFMGDFLFQITAARPMPLYGVPGLIDHF